MSVSRGMRAPGGANGFASTPDANPFTPTTSIEVRVVAAADDWTPPAISVLAAQSGIIGDIAWSLAVDTAGQLNFGWSSNGTTGGNVNKAATQTPPGINGYPRGLGARLVLATGDVTFLHSTDDVTWTEFETDVSSGPTSVFNSSQSISVAAAANALPLAGRVLRVELRVDGQIVADPRFDEQLPGTTVFDDSRSNRWALAAAAFIEAHKSFAPTTEQILNLDGVHRRIDRFRFELCDRHLNPIGELHPYRTDSIPTIENTATERRLRSFRLAPDEADDINTITDRLRVYMTLQNGAEFRLGTFLWASEGSPLRSWGTQHDGELVDFNYVLDQPVTQAFGWTRGTDVGLIVVFLVLRAGFPLDVFAPANDHNKRVLAEPKSWQPGTTWRQMIDDMADVIGFAHAWFDRDGRFHFQQQPDPLVDAPTVDPYEPGTRIVADSILLAKDIVDAPNDFAVFDSGTEKLMIGRYQVPANAPHSFANRGFRVGLVESSRGGENQAQLNNAAFNLARRGGRAFETLEFDSTADPRHDTNDIVPALGQTWVETGWTLQCRSGGLMHHRLRRTIYAVA